jgi:hypothetical protein
MMDVARIRKYILGPAIAVSVLLAIWIVYFIYDQRRLSDPYYVDELYQKGFYVETVQPDGSWIMTKSLLDGSVRRTRATPWQAEHASRLWLKPANPATNPSIKTPSPVYVPVGIIQVIPLSASNAISVDPAKLSSVVAMTGNRTVQPHDCIVPRRHKGRIRAAAKLSHRPACRTESRDIERHQYVIPSTLSTPPTRRQRKNNLQTEARIEDIPEDERSEEWINQT